MSTDAFTAFPAPAPLAAHTDKQRRKLMIDVDLTPEAFALVREGVTAKSGKGGTHKVLMPRKLADKLNAIRDFGEDMSDVILRLADEAKSPANRRSFR
jgi:hypothetical protein